MRGFGFVSVRVISWLMAVLCLHVVCFDLACATETATSVPPLAEERKRLRVERLVFQEALGRLTVSLFPTERW